MTIQRMSFAHWITKATDTHSQCVIFLFHCKFFYANAPHCYVVRTSPVLLQQDIIHVKLSRVADILPKYVGEDLNSVGCSPCTYKFTKQVLAVDIQDDSNLERCIVNMQPRKYADNT
jgi:hypothetical protein